jgi:hypothetical protein
MRRNYFFVGILAILLVLGMSVIGCDNNTPGTSIDSVDSTIIGKWYDTQENANADGTTGLMFTIKSEGAFTEGNNNPYNSGHYGTSCTTSGGVITTWDGSEDKASASYSVNGTVLNLTNGDHAWSGITPVTYYKKASNASQVQNPFKGTWKSSDASAGLMYFYDTTFEFDKEHPDNYTCGTYTYSGNSATLIETSESDHPGDVHNLTITGNTFTWFWFTFTKQ